MEQWYRITYSDTALGKVTESIWDDFCLLTEGVETVTIRGCDDNVDREVTEASQVSLQQTFSREAVKHL